MADLAANLQLPAAQPSPPGLLNTFLADTFGVIWSAASGTVDPWTKNQIVYDAGVGSLGPANSPAAIAQVAGDADPTVTAALTAIGGDPSQVTAGLANSVADLNPFGPNSFLNPANWSATEIVLIGGLIIAAILFFGWTLKK